MTNGIISKMRLLLLIFSLCGMTFGLISPANMLRRVAAEEKQKTSVKSGDIAASTEQVNQQLSKTSVYFEENRGQFDKHVRYLARGNGGAMLFLTATEAVYVLQDPKSEIRSPKSDGAANDLRATNDEPHLAVALYMRLAGANRDAGFSGQEQLAHRTNYFKGSDPNGWQTDVPNYQRVAAKNIYNGVDMIWHGNTQSEIQYDFVVAPNANPQQIEWEIEGANNVSIDVEGNLLIETEAGVMKQTKPFSFQETGGLRAEIESGFRVMEPSAAMDGSKLKSFRVKFNVGEYDRTKSLIIDPSVNLYNLAFSTFLSGESDDVGHAIAVDSVGNVYATGDTQSALFPTTAGAFDTTHNEGSDVFVTKLNATGTALIYSTFIGGSGYDRAYGIALDASGNAYITGETYDSPTDYPTTPGAFDTTHNDGSDVFVTKLNATGTALIYSTFIGGGGFDFGSGIALDASGNAYVTGHTWEDATDYPTTPGAFNPTHNGNSDVFVTKLNATGTALIYSTFIGGGSVDFGSGIALDASGNAYVTGYTLDDATDYPTTPGAFDTTHNGSYDVFVTKLNATGMALIYSTFIGGGSDDQAYGIALDASGNACITGYTSDDATDYPTTAGAFDTTHNGGIIDIFVTKLNAFGNGLFYSTFIGGSGNDRAYGIALDGSNNVYVTGETVDAATDYPTTVLAFNTTHNGSSDVFVTKLNGGGTALIYSTFIGGSGNDQAYGIALDASGNAYVTGETVDAATDYPTTPEAFQPLPSGGFSSDAFISKLGDFAIAGRVIDPAGAPLANVMVAMSGQLSGFIITGTDGLFCFTDTVAYQPHSVSATRAGYNINPSLYNITSLQSNRELIFVGTVGGPSGGTGGTLRFASLSYSKGENGTSVNVTVERTGTVITTEPVTVDFQTTSGTAFAGQDFVQTSGILTYQFFEHSKTITVPIMNDSALEPRENFGIVLSNPTNNAEIDPNRASTNVQILDEDLSNGNLLISEFRLRGRLGPSDEYVKLFNPNPFDVTVFASDESGGLTLARTKGGDVSSVVTIPNLITIPAHGHYLLTNNNPFGGFSLIDYPTGIGTTTAVGDQTFAGNIPDNSNLVLLKTANPKFFNSDNSLDAVGFGTSAWTTEGNTLPAISAEDSESCFVRRLTLNGLQDTNDNRADFLLVDNHARSFEGDNQTKIYSALGSPAPETSESLRLMMVGEVGWTEFSTAGGIEVYDPTPVPNGALGTLTLYRRITNNTTDPLTRLRLRVIDFPTVGSQSQRRYSSRPDFRIFSSTDEGEFIKGVTLAADRLQPNGGGINSTLTIDAITQDNPLQPGGSVVVAIRLGVMRYGRHPFHVAFEAMR